MVFNVSHAQKITSGNLCHLRHVFTILLTK